MRSCLLLTMGLWAVITSALPPGYRNGLYKKTYLPTFDPNADIAQPAITRDKRIKNKTPPKPEDEVAMSDYEQCLGKWLDIKASARHLSNQPQTPQPPNETQCTRTDRYSGSGCRSSRETRPTTQQRYQASPDPRYPGRRPLRASQTQRDPAGRRRSLQTSLEGRVDRC